MSSASPMSEITSNDAVLIDVRTAAERAIQPSPLSTHCSLSDIENGRLPDLDKDTKIYLHCRSGARSERARQLLVAHGFHAVTNIGGVNDLV